MNKGVLSVPPFRSQSNEILSCFETHDEVTSCETPGQGPHRSLRKLSLSYSVLASFARLFAFSRFTFPSGILLTPRISPLHLTKARCPTVLYTRSGLGLSPVLLRPSHTVFEAGVKPLNAIWWQRPLVVEEESTSLRSVVLLSLFRSRLDCSTPTRATDKRRRRDVREGRWELAHEATDGTRLLCRPSAPFALRCTGKPDAFRVIYWGLYEVECKL